MRPRHLKVIFPPFLLRASAWMLCLSLLFSDLPASAAPAPAASPAPSFLNLPEELGHVEEAAAGRLPGTVIFIQDAHDSLEAQEKIAALIHHFVEKAGVRTVFEEGYEGPVPGDDYFGFLKNPEVRERVSYFLLDELRIGGAEYAHINRKKDFTLVGGDDALLHRENIEWYRKTAAMQAEADADLKVLENEIASLASRYFPEDLKTWMRFKARFDAGQMGFDDYLARLLNLSALKAKDGVLIPDASARYPQTAHLAAMKASAAHAAPADAVLDARALIREIAELEDETARRLAPGDRERRIFAFYKDLLLLRRLNALSLSSEEYAALISSIQGLKTDDFARFITRETGKPAAFSRRWEENAANAAHFYETAARRDLGVEQKLRNFFKTSEESAAILVFGGFHQKAIRDMLRRAGFSYQIVSPVIQELNEVHQVRYRQRMTEQYDERLLSGPASAAASRALSDFAAAELSSEYRAGFKADLALLEKAALGARGQTRADLLLSMRDQLRRFGESRSELRAAKQERITHEILQAEVSALSSSADLEIGGNDRTGWAVSTEKRSDHGYLHALERKLAERFPKYRFSYYHDVRADQNFKRLDILPPLTKRSELRFGADVPKLENIRNLDDLSSRQEASEFAVTDSQESVRSELREEGGIVLGAAVFENPLWLLAVPPVLAAAVYALYQAYQFWISKRLAEALARGARYLARGSYTHVLKHTAFPGYVILVKRHPFVMRLKQGEAIRSPQVTEAEEWKAYKALKKLGLAPFTRYAGKFPMKSMHPDWTGTEGEEVFRTDQKKLAEMYGKVSSSMMGVSVYLQEEGVPLNKFVRENPDQKILADKSLANFTLKLWRAGWIDLDIGRRNYLLITDHEGRPLKDADGLLRLKAHDFGAIMPIPEDLERFLLSKHRDSDVTRGFFLLRNLTATVRAAAVLYPRLDLKRFHEISKAADEAAERMKARGDKEAFRSAYLGVIESPENKKVITELSIEAARMIQKALQNFSRSELRADDAGDRRERKRLERRMRAEAEKRIRAAKEVFRKRVVLISLVSAALLAAGSVYWMLPRIPAQPAAQAPSDAVVERQRFATIRNIPVTDMTNAVTSQDPDLIDAIAAGYDGADPVRKSQIAGYEIQVHPADAGEPTQEVFHVKAHFEPDVAPPFEDIPLRRGADTRINPVDLNAVSRSISGGRIVIVEQVREWMAWAPLAMIGVIAILAYAFFRGARRVDTGSIMDVKSASDRSARDISKMRAAAEKKRQEKDPDAGRSELRSQEEIDRLFLLKETAKIRAAHMKKMNRELLELFPFYRALKKTPPEEDPGAADRILDQIRAYADGLETFAARVAPERGSPDEAREKARYEAARTLAPGKLRDHSQDLDARIRALSPEFSKAYTERDTARLESLNRQAAALYKERLITQIRQTVTHLRASKTNESAILSLLMALHNTYQKLAQEYAWQWRRAVMKAGTDRIRVVGRGGDVQTVYDYGTFRVFKVPGAAEGEPETIAMVQNRWKRYEHPDGRAAYRLEPVRIVFRDEDAEFRSQLHTLVSQENDYSQLLFHINALDYAADLLKAHQENLPAYVRDQIENGLAEVMEGDGGLSRGKTTQKQEAAASVEAALAGLKQNRVSEPLGLLQDAMARLQDRLKDIEGKRDGVFARAEYIASEIRKRETARAVKSAREIVERRAYAEAQSLLELVYQTHYQPLGRSADAYPSVKTHLTRVIARLRAVAASPAQEESLRAGILSDLEHLEKMTRSELRAVPSEAAAAEGAETLLKFIGQQNGMKLSRIGYRFTIVPGVEEATMKNLLLNFWPEVTSLIGSDNPEVWPERLQGIEEGMPGRVLLERIRPLFLAMSRFGRHESEGDGDFRLELAVRMKERARESDPEPIRILIAGPGYLQEAVEALAAADAAAETLPAEEKARIRVELLVADQPGELADRYRANALIYHPFDAAFLPAEIRDRYLEPVQGGYRIRPEVLGRMTFYGIDLNRHRDYGALGLKRGSLDFVLNHNLSSYLKPRAVRRFSEFLHAAMRDNGLMYGRFSSAHFDRSMLGLSEGAYWLGDLFEYGIALNDRSRYPNLMLHKFYKKGHSPYKRSLEIDGWMSGLYEEETLRENALDPEDEGWLDRVLAPARSELRAQDPFQKLKESLLGLMTVEGRSETNKIFNAAAEQLKGASPSVKGRFKKLLLELLDNRLERQALRGIGSSERETSAWQRAVYRRLYEHLYDGNGRLRKDIKKLETLPPAAASLKYEDTFTIRAGQKKETLRVERLMSLSQSDWSQIFEIYAPHNLREFHRDLISGRRSLSGNENAVFVVRTSENKIAGFAWAFADPAKRMLGLAVSGVAKPYRGQGLAARLLISRLEWGMSNGLTYARTHVGDSGRNSGWHWRLLALGGSVDSLILKSPLPEIGIRPEDQAAADRAVRAAQQEAYPGSRKALEGVLKKYPGADLAVNFDLRWRVIEKAKGRVLAESVRPNAGALGRESTQDLEDPSSRSELRARADESNTWKLLKEQMDQLLTLYPPEGSDDFYDLTDEKGFFRGLRELLRQYQKAEAARNAGAAEARSLFEVFQNSLTALLARLEFLVGEDYSKLTEFHPGAANATFGVMAVQIKPEILQDETPRQFFFGLFSLKQLTESGALKVDTRDGVVVSPLPEVKGVLADRYPEVMREKLEKIQALAAAFEGENQDSRSELRAELDLQDFVNRIISSHSWPDIIEVDIDPSLRIRETSASLGLAVFELLKNAIDGNRVYEKKSGTDSKPDVRLQAVKKEGWIELRIINRGILAVDKLRAQAHEGGVWKLRPWTPDKHRWPYPYMMESSMPDEPMPYQRMRPEEIDALSDEDLLFHVKGLTLRSDENLRRIGLLRADLTGGMGLGLKQVWRVMEMVDPERPVHYETGEIEGVPSVVFSVRFPEARSELRNLEEPAPALETADFFLKRLGTLSGTPSAAYSPLELSPEGKMFFFETLKTTLAASFGEEMRGYTEADVAPNAYAIKDDKSGVPLGVLYQFGTLPIFFDFIELTRPTTEAALLNRDHSGAWAAADQAARRVYRKELGQVHFLERLTLAGLSSDRSRWVGEKERLEKKVSGGLLSLFVISEVQDWSRKADIFLRPDQIGSLDYQQTLFRISRQRPEFFQSNLGITGFGTGVDALLAARFGAEAVHGTEPYAVVHLLGELNVRYARESGQIPALLPVTVDKTRGLAKDGAVTTWFFNTPLLVKNGTRSTFMPANVHLPVGFLPSTGSLYLEESEFQAILTETAERLAGQPGKRAVMRVDGDFFTTPEKDMTAYLESVRRYLEKFGLSLTGYYGGAFVEFQAADYGPAGKEQYLKSAFKILEEDGKALVPAEALLWFIQQLESAAVSAGDGGALSRDTLEAWKKKLMGNPRETRPRSELRTPSQAEYEQIAAEAERLRELVAVHSLLQNKPDGTGKSDIVKALTETRDLSREHGDIRQIADIVKRANSWYPGRVKRNYYQFDDRDIKKQLAAFSRAVQKILRDSESSRSELRSSFPEAVPALDAGRIYTQDGDFSRAVEYFNTEILKGRPAAEIPDLGWADVIALYEKIRGDDRNPDYTEDERLQRLMHSEESWVLEWLYLINHRVRDAGEARDLAVSIYRTSSEGLDRDQMLVNKAGFRNVRPPAREGSMVQPHPADGHHRLAWFLMNFFLIRSGYPPFYFKDETEYLRIPSEDYGLKKKEDRLAEYLSERIFAPRSELRTFFEEAGTESRPVEKMTVPAAVFLDARELPELAADEADERLDELLTLLERHPAFDLYIDYGDRVSLPDAQGRLSQILNRFPSRVHFGEHGRANLAKKKILLHVSLKENAGSADETRRMIRDVQRRYRIQSDLLPVEYLMPGTLKGFLDLAESFSAAELIREIGEAFAVRTASGRWRIAEDFAASLWTRIRNDYAIQWSA